MPGILCIWVLEDIVSMAGMICAFKGRSSKNACRVLMNQQSAQSPSLCSGKVVAAFAVSPPPQSSVGWTSVFDRLKAWSHHDRLLVVVSMQGSGEGTSHGSTLRVP